ncbi:MAG: DUF192 domain-containing protein [Elusimicrobiota bacterium]
MLWVEIADTPEKQRSGLMFRKKLSSESGMLFKFSYPQKLKFWGFNTFIPLDIAFVSKDNIITNINSIEPLSKNTVASSSDCVIAIEANKGFFEINNIRPGDKIILSDNNDEDKHLVVFDKNRG